MALLLFFATLLTHSIYVSLFASDYPFWDQWDQLRAELIPWWEGHGHLSLLFAPHNEHRIFFTRILSMFLLWMNHGHWSNLVEAYAGSLVWAGVLSLFLVFATRDVKASSMRIVLALCIICLGCLPYDWENTLVGFQSQFYFLVGAATLMAACAAYLGDTLLRQVLMLALGVASVFTMASGLLAPLAGVVMLGMRGLPVRAWSSRTLFTAGGLIATAVFGWFILPRLPGSIPLQAHGIAEHAKDMLVVLMWPLVGSSLKAICFIPLLWLPVAFGLGKTFLGKRSAESELFLLGIAGWVMVQGVAIAHARGHDLTAIPSRYTDIVVLGVLANLALTMLWVSSRDESRRIRTLSAAWLLLMVPLLGWIMIHRTPVDVSDMSVRGAYSEIETINVSEFLATGDEHHLEHPGILEIPYKSASLLRSYLLDPGMRSLIASTHASAADAWLTQQADALRGRERILASRLGMFPPARFQPLKASPIMSGEVKPPALCFVDMLNGRKPSAAVMRSGELFSIQGWIVWPEGVSSSDEAVVMLSGRARYQVDLDMAANRPDVVAVMHSAPSLTRGFSVAAPLGQVLPGTYSVAIAKPSPPVPAIYCSLPIAVTVTR